MLSQKQTISGLEERSEGTQTGPEEDLVFGLEPRPGLGWVSLVMANGIFQVGHNQRGLLSSLSFLQSGIDFPPIEK